MPHSVCSQIISEFRNAWFIYICYSEEHVSQTETCQICKNETIAPSPPEGGRAEYVLLNCWCRYCSGKDNEWSNEVFILPLNFRTIDCCCRSAYLYICIYAYIHICMRFWFQFLSLELSSFAMDRYCDDIETLIGILLCGGWRMEPNDTWSMLMRSIWT